MSNADKPFGIDVSRYQGRIRWDEIAAHRPRVEFAGIRASVSWGYKDAWFAHNWAEAKRVGILRMAYHVQYPGENPRRQMDNFLGMLNGDWGELPLVLDCELDHGYTPGAIAANALAMAEIIENKTGRKPIFYSRASWVDVHFRGAKWLNNYDWWLAHYLNGNTNEHPGPPGVPSGVTRPYLIHQTGTIVTEPYPHLKAGVDSKELDWNRWNGSLQELYNYANLSQPLPEDDDPDLYLTFGEAFDLAASAMSKAAAEWERVRKGAR